LFLVGVTTKDGSVSARPSPGELLEWFFHARRDLPWRTPRNIPRDPWKTLVSEIMSQQTRLEVVVPRFLEWMGRFPSPKELAAASEEEVLAAWAGLGYYSRARNLRLAARRVREKGWPATRDALMALPGVGAYTAAALASLCFGEQVPMVDGNVLRVLSRVHALDRDPRSGPGSKRLQALAEAWIQDAQAGEVNEATMEHGALICLPRSPRCSDCPLSGICRACALGEPERFPPRRARSEKVRLDREVLVVPWREGILLRPARADELLSDLWILPSPSDHPSLAAVGDPFGTIRHSITVHDVRWSVSRGEFRSRKLPEGWIACPAEELRIRVVSSLVRKCLELSGVPV
jgi:A/G-specific adenine glycosylase